VTGRRARGHLGEDWCAPAAIRAASASFAGGFVPPGDAGRGCSPGADRDAFVFRPRLDVAAALPGCLGTRPTRSNLYRLSAKSAKTFGDLVRDLARPGLAPNRRDGLDGTDSAGINPGLPAMMTRLGVMHFVRPGATDVEGVIWNFDPWQ
jgi:hypothetical protein